MNALRVKAINATTFFTGQHLKIEMYTKLLVLTNSIVQFVYLCSRNNTDKWIFGKNILIVVRPKTLQIYSCFNSKITIMNYINLIRNHTTHLSVTAFNYICDIQVITLHMLLESC